jgi:preprotein translocase subunit SecF
MTLSTDPSIAAGDTAWPFTRWRRLGFGLSLALILLTAGALAVRGLSLGLDFTGGVLVEAQGANFDVGALRAALATEGIAEAVVQLADEGRTALVRAPGEGGGAALAAITAALGPDATVRAADVVGPKVSGELLRSGALAALSAVAAIGVYIWFRFEARFGLAAFLTTLHDVVLMVGLYAVTGLTFDLTSVAALLAVAGYSINDTVVIFDRVRELQARARAAPLDRVIDLAITSTLRRTLMTSGTTLVTTVALMVLGGPVLFGFAAAVTFGIVAGTASSIVIAAPLLLHLPGRVAPAEPVDADTP